jgi:3-methyladenine DNA glycosylase/8-oxoguanine DNA glycosylase
MPLEYDRDVAVAHVKSADPQLARVIDAIGPFDLEPREGAFKALSRAIFFQQLAGPAARAIMNRTLAALGANEEDWYTPEQMIVAGEEEMRAAGLSRMKLVYLRDLAEHFADGRLSEDDFHHLEDDAVIERASMVKGIGRWTAEMFLMFTLGRPDVLPVDDLGVRNGMRITYALDVPPKPDRMREIAAPWEPYRSVGTWYMWRALGVDVPEQGRGYKPEDEKLYEP